MAAPSQTLGRRAGGGEVNTRSDALPAAPEIWAPRDSHIQFLPRPPSGTPPCRPGGAGAAAGAGSRVRSPAKQRTSGGTYLRRRRLSSPRTSHRPASGARAGSSGLRAAAGGSGYGERPGRARGVPAAGMVRRRRPPGARGGRVGAARGREGEGASAPAAVAVALPLPAPARSCGSGIGFRDRVIRSLLTHRP